MSSPPTYLSPQQAMRPSHWALIRSRRMHTPRKSLTPQSIHLTYTSYLHTRPIPKPPHPIHAHHKHTTTPTPIRSPFPSSTSTRRSTHHRTTPHPSRVPSPSHTRSTRTPVPHANLPSQSSHRRNPTRVIRPAHSHAPSHSAQSRRLVTRPVLSSRPSHLQVRCRCARPEKASGQCDGESKSESRYLRDEYRRAGKRKGNETRSETLILEGGLGERKEDEAVAR